MRSSPRLARRCASVAAQKSANSARGLRGAVARPPRRAGTGTSRPCGATSRAAAAPSPRDAEQVGDDDDRDRRGEGVQQVEPAAGLEAVDQRVGQAATRGRNRSTCRDTNARFTSLRSRVCGRLELQQRVPLDRVEVREMGIGLRPAELCRASRRAGSAGRSARSRSRADTSRAGGAPVAVGLATRTAALARSAS